jgi:hypothetical protein
MKLLRKIATGFAVSLLALGLTPGVANASTVNGCAEDAVCLFQWINYGGDKWQSSFYNISIHGGQCLNILPATWSNGTAVTNNSASMVVNGSGAYSQSVSVSLYINANCQYTAGGGVASYNANWATSRSNLSNVAVGGGANAYHNYESISINVVGIPGT